MRHAYLEAFNVQDIDGICATFTADVVAIPPDREAFVGREALAAFYREMYDHLGDVRIEQDPLSRASISPARWPTASAATLSASSKTAHPSPRTAASRNLAPRSRRLEDTDRHVEQPAGRVGTKALGSLSSHQTSCRI